MPPFHRSVRDLTDKALPTLFFFVVVASVTVVLTYSNGFKEPVPRDVITGLTATLGILVFLFAIGRTLLYFKGPLPPEVDVEQVSVGSRLHPTMAPVSITYSTTQQSSQRQREAALVHTAPYPESDTMMGQITPNRAMPDLPNQVASQESSRCRQAYGNLTSSPVRYRSEREVDPYHPFPDIQRVQPYRTPTRVPPRAMAAGETSSGQSWRHGRTFHQDGQLSRADARRRLPSFRQGPKHENIGVNNAVLSEEDLRLQFPLLSFLMEHSLLDDGSAHGGRKSDKPTRLTCRDPNHGGVCRHGASVLINKRHDPDSSENKPAHVEADDCGSGFSASSEERASPPSDAHTLSTTQTSEEVYPANYWENWG